MREFVSCTEVSYIVRVTLAVHCTAWQAIIEKSGQRDRCHRPRKPSASSSSTRPPRRSTPSSRSRPRRSRQSRPSTPRRSIVSRRISKPSMSGRRTDRGMRKPRFNRSDIAAAAIRIADAEGFRSGVDAPPRRRARRRNDDALSLRAHQGRVAHADRRRIPGEVVLSAGVNACLATGDAAITLIARRTRDALAPPSVDPRHRLTIPTSAPTPFATSTSRGRRWSRWMPSFEDKLDLISVVDEYVFGFCLHERNNPAGDARERHRDGRLHRCTACSKTTTRRCRRWCRRWGLESLWTRIHTHADGAGRFDRNLARLLAGFEASLSSPR